MSNFLPPRLWLGLPNQNLNYSPSTRQPNSEPTLGHQWCCWPVAHWVAFAWTFCFCARGFSAGRGQHGGGWRGDFWRILLCPLLVWEHCARVSFLGCHHLPLSAVLVDVVFWECKGDAS